MAKKPMTEEQVLEGIVETPRGCWVWQGPFHPEGYACRKNDWFQLIHRESYKLWKGEIPTGYHIDHRCGDKTCVNPDHLFAVTRSMNMYLKYIEKTKQMPWKDLRVARHFHRMVADDDYREFVKTQPYYSKTKHLASW